MATSTNYAWEMRRDALITLSLQMAGLMHASHVADAAQLALGKNFLSMSLTALQADGIILRAVERYSQTLTDGQVSYTCPADTIDVEDGAVIRNTQSFDVPLKLLSTHRDYLSRGVKTITGQPVEYYPEKQSDGSIVIYLYPVPTSDWPTLIYPRVRKLRDNDSGNVSIDVPVKFTQAVARKLAAEWAFHYNRPALAKTLMDQYEDERDRALGDETPRGPLRLMVDNLFWDR